MITTALPELIAEAEREDRLWAVLVSHVDGRLEIHAWNGAAGTVLNRESMRGPVAASLLIAEPVSCADAALAGLDPLNECARCEATIPGAVS